MAISIERLAEISQVPRNELRYTLRQLFGGEFESTPIPKALVIRALPWLRLSTEKKEFLRESEALDEISDEAVDPTLHFDLNSERAIRSSPFEVLENAWSQSVPQQAHFYSWYTEDIFQKPKPDESDYDFSLEWQSSLFYGFSQKEVDKEPELPFQLGSRDSLSESDSASIYSYFFQLFGKLEKKIERGDENAAQVLFATARYATMLLNSLKIRHAKTFESITRRSINWPVMFSNHPKFRDDTSSLEKALGENIALPQVGAHSDIKDPAIKIALHLLWHLKRERDRGISLVKSGIKLNEDWLIARAALLPVPEAVTADLWWGVALRYLKAAYPQPCEHPILATAAFGYPSYFTTEDITDLESLARRITCPQRTDMISAFLATQLSGRTRKILAEYKGGTNWELQCALVDDLNYTLNNAQLYDLKRFVGIQLSPEAARFLKERTPGGVYRPFGLLLLHGAYPKELRKLSSNKRQSFTGHRRSGKKRHTPGNHNSFIVRNIHDKFKTLLGKNKGR